MSTSSNFKDFSLHFLQNSIILRLDCASLFLDALLRSCSNKNKNERHLMEQTVSFHRLSEIAGLGSPAETALVIHAVRIFSLMYLFRGYEPVLLDCAYVANETDLEYFRSARAAVKTRLSNGTNAYNTAQKERGPSRLSSFHRIP